MQRGGKFKSKSKGFTLIELLAIIVILAIIAVITVPVILNVIDSAKEGAAKVSATGYIKAVDNQLMVNGMDTNPDNDIRSDGSKTAEQLETIYGVSVNGEKPLNKSTVTFTNGEVTGYRLYISGYIITMTSGVVTVTKDDGSYIQVDSISAPSTLNVTVGETANITVTFNPTDATNRSLLFTSSDESIATVDSNGVVTGHTVNETVAITATSTDNSSATATINVTVNPAPILVTGVDITDTDFTLLPEDTKQLSATVTPSDATEGSVKWRSGNSAIATVDEATGLVTARGKGSTTITTTSNSDSSKSDTVNVSVSNYNSNCVLAGNRCDLETQIKTNEGVRLYVNVDEEHSYHFHVIADNGTQLTLQMDSNIATGSGSEWYRKNESPYYDNRFGPVTALTKLHELTSDWTNVLPMKNYTYNEGNYTYGYQSAVWNTNGELTITGNASLDETKRTNIIGSASTPMRARMITAEEVASLIGDSGWNIGHFTGKKDTTPDWMKLGISSSKPYGYWTLGSYYPASNDDYAWKVQYAGALNNDDTNRTYNGVRPVINILKSDSF